MRNGITPWPSHSSREPSPARRFKRSSITGEALKNFGVTSLPAPVEEPGFSGGIRATAPFITQDRETGVRNVGMYSGHFRGEDRLIAGIAPTHHAMLYHHRDAIQRREPLPVAIVLGALPDINFVSAANLPYGVDELGGRGRYSRPAGGRGVLVKPFRWKFRPMRKSSSRARFPSIAKSAASRSAIIPAI